LLPHQLPIHSLLLSRQCSVSSVLPGAMLSIPDRPIGT
jgi:hypothetical protein